MLLDLGVSLGAKAPTGGLPGVVFDGTNDWLGGGTGGPAVGFSDTQSFSMHATIRDITNAGANGYLWGSENSNYMRFTTGTGVPRLRIGSVINFQDGSTQIANLSGDVEINLAVDGVNGTAELWVNDSQEISLTGLGTFTVLYEEQIGFCSSNGIGSGKAGLTAKLWQVWDDVVLDVTNSSVRAQMADITQSATLGNNVVTYYGQAAEWATNRGTGSNLVVNGTLTDA